MPVIAILGALVAMAALLWLGEFIYKRGYKRCQKDWLEYGKTCDHRGREIILEGAKFCWELRKAREFD